MKKLSKKTRGIVKGAPSGFVISLLVHAAAFMLAGLLVVLSMSDSKKTRNRNSTLRRTTCCFGLMSKG